MDCNINGVTCIKGEIHSIMTLMRLHTRWSQTKLARDVSYHEDDALVQSFRRLNEYLEGSFDLREVDCVMYIMPFHNIIVSEKASGPLTSCALTSLSKFALYGFLSEHCPRVQEGISLISNCISRCVFEETDWESDELILMKLLELSALCYRCSASRLLTISSAWEIYNTCVSIHNHYRASKILKSEAENALVHLTLSMFGRILQQPASRGQRNVSNKHAIMQEIESMRSRSWESIKDNYNLSSDIGVTLLLMKTMNALSDMADSQKQPVEMVKFSLVLINIALETGGPALGTVPPLVDILSNQVCRNLLRASQSDDLAIISLALRVVFNLFMSIKNHMKVQLEVFLISVHLRLINASSVQVPVGTINGSPPPAAKEELALESLLEFCREPSLMNDIYVNYDCDVQCTNLFDTIINTLCSRALPVTLQAGTSLAKIKATSTPATAPTPGSSNKAKSRAVEAASPSSQLLDFGSTGSLFGLDNPAPSVQSVPAQGSAPAPVRLSIVNRLALDGVLAVLRAVAGRCVSSVKLEGVNSTGNRQASGELSDTVAGAFLSIDPIEGLNAGISVGTSSSAVDGGGVEQLVDKWCESGSTSPTADMLSQEDFDVSHNAAAVASQWPHSRHAVSNMGSDAASSTGGSPFAGVHGEAGLSAVDGENEVTAAVIQARARQAELLRQRKLMKHKYKLAAEKFNNKPLKPDWIRFAMDLGILERSPTNTSAVSSTSTAASSGVMVAHHGSDEKEKEVAAGTKDAHRVDAHRSETAASASHGAKPDALKLTLNEPTTGIDAAALARFFRRTPGLGKTQIGEYISKGPPDMYPFHTLVLKEYVKTFDFSGENSSFDAALRMFLGEFKLPGEAQCIDRIMEAFAGHLYEHLGPGRPFATADAAYILAFSTIMLNTDLHNPQIPQSKKMTKAEFVRNNRGINDGKDIPQDYLEKLYSEIKNRQIQVDIDITDTTTALGFMDFADNTMWNKLLHKGSADQEPAIFTSTTDARRNSLPLATSSAFEKFPVAAASHQGLSLSALKDGGVGGHSVPCSLSLSRAQSGASTAASQRALYERDMFLVMARPVLETLVVLYENATEDQLVCRILRGLWDFISICADFGLHQMLNSTVHLLCFRSRALLESERRVPLKPHTRHNVLAHKAHFKQLQADTGLDLHALVSLDFDALITYQNCPVNDRHEHTKFQTTAEHASLQLQANKPEVSWSYAWMIKGELLMRVAFHTAEQTPFALQEDAWSAVLTLLAWVRSRGALPPALALVGEDFRVHEVHWQDALPEAGAGIEAPSTMLPPSVYAHRCYLEAYGLALERSNGRSSSDTTAASLHHTHYGTHAGSSSGNQAAGAWFGLGFLFSEAPSDSGPRHHGVAMTSPSGTLDLPNLYRNANASLCVSMTGEPLRPDDEILKLCVERCKPAELVYQASLGDVEVTSTVFRSMLSLLSAMLKQLTATPRAATALSLVVPPAVRSVSGTSSVSSSAVDAVDLENSFPVQMLSNQFVPSVTKELDAVVLLEWITHITLRNDESLRLFWGDMHDFLKTVLEENVEQVAARCPYLLERCISVLTRAVLHVVGSNSHQGTEQVARETGRQVFRPAAPPLTKSLLHSAALASSSQQAAWNAVWQSLRLMRGIPSDVMVNVSDRLGVAVLELLKNCHAQPHLMTSERWFMMFSLLSAASSGSAGRSFVWDAVRYLIDNDLVNDANFTACRHLVLRFVHGVFPGDSSEEQRNKASGAASARKKPHFFERKTGELSAESEDHVVSSVGYLLRLCLMAIAGYRAKFSKPSDLSVPQPDKYLRSPLMLQGPSSDTSNGRSSSKVTFSLAVHSSGPGARNPKNADLHGMGSPSAIPAGPTPAAALSPMRDVGEIQQTITVPSIYFPRAEEVELLWLETCKIYADLSHSPNETVSARATESLHTITRAGMASTFADVLVLKALGELVTRLPLGFSHAVARTANVEAPGQDASSIAHSIAHAVSASQRACNVVFEVVVAEFKSARDTEEFHGMWVRFIGLVASNASAAVPKGQRWWHDEMCDMLEALLRLLRLPQAPPPPAATTAPKTSPRLNADDGSAKPIEAKSAPQAVEQPASNGGYFGILGWLVAPLVAATDGPDVVRSAAHTSSGTHPQAPAQELTPAEIIPSDGYLLRVSWQQICSAYPAFPASLQARDPKLLSRISAALSLPERYLQKNAKSVLNNAAHKQFGSRAGSQPVSLPGEPSPERPIPVTVNQSDTRFVNEPAPQPVPHAAYVTEEPTEVDLIAVSSLRTKEPVIAPLSIGGSHQATPSKQPQLPPALPSSAVSAASNSSEMDTITLTSIDRSDMSLASHTPLRPALSHQSLDLLGTPLADTSVSVIMPTPVETPAEEHNGHSLELSPSVLSTGQRMPFVRDLTPIFAEEERRGASAEPSADKTGVARRLEVGSPAAGPWKTYPMQSPHTPGTPLVPTPQAAASADGRVPPHGTAVRATPAKVISSRPPSSRVQIV